MTDITAELAALPKMPVERTYWTTNAHPHTEISGVYVEAIEARLALAERLLDTTMTELSPALYLAACEDARAYLAHRAKETT